jgi:hypothetical protein
MNIARKIGFGLLWLSFGLYAFLLAPPDRPDTNLLIQNLIAGNWQNINPLVVALFNLMGVFPGVYACLLFADGRGQSTPAWLFVILSFGIGAFGLLPYFALRSPNPKFSGKKNWLIRFWDSRLTGLGLSAIAIALIIYGLKTGDLSKNWAEYLVQFQTSRFIQVMSLDFCLLSLMFTWVLGDDMKRRGLDRQSNRKSIFRLVSSLPLLGPLAYLCLRPNLIAESDQIGAPRINNLGLEKE